MRKKIQTIIISLFVVFNLFYSTTNLALKNYSISLQSFWNTEWEN